MDDDTPQLRRLEVPPPGLAPLCNAALRRGAEVDVFELEISAETLCSVLDQNWITFQCGGTIALSPSSTPPLIH